MFHPSPRRLLYSPIRIVLDAHSAEECNKFVLICTCATHGAEILGCRRCPFSFQAYGALKSKNSAETNTHFTPARSHSADQTLGMCCVADSTHADVLVASATNGLKKHPPFFLASFERLCVGGLTRDPRPVNGLKYRLSIDGTNRAAGCPRQRVRWERNNNDGPLAALVKLQAAHGNLASRYVIDDIHRPASIQQKARVS